MREKRKFILISSPALALCLLMTFNRIYSINILGSHGPSWTYRRTGREGSPRTTGMDLALKLILNLSYTFFNASISIVIEYGMYFLFIDWYLKNYLIYKS